MLAQRLRQSRSPVCERTTQLPTMTCRCNTMFHDLPLLSSQIFECASVGKHWKFGDPLPNGIDWKQLTKERATEVVRCTRRVDPMSCPFPTTNFSSGKPQGMLKYHFQGEQGGACHFTHCLCQHDDIVAREAKPVAVSLIVTMKEITATTMAGTTAIEYTRKDGEGMRAITLRSIIHKQMVAGNKMSVVQPIKLMRDDRVLRGNVVIWEHGQPHGCRRMDAQGPQQTVISKFFRR